MSENCFDRQRAAVVRLTEAVRARAAADAELKAVYEAAVERAEREASRARKSNAAARDGELGRIDETHTASAGAIERKYDAEQYAADRGRDDRRTTTTEKFKSAEDRGRTEHADRLWHIDSMLEAGEKAAKEQLESLQRKAAGGTERIAVLWSQAEPALGRGRVTRAEVEVTGQLPHPNDDDPITRMNKSLQSSEEAAQRLARLYSPKWSSPTGIIICAVAAGVIGALISFPFLDLRHVHHPHRRDRGRAGRGVLALRTLARPPLNGNARQGPRRHLAEGSRACRLLNDFAAWEYAEERVRISERHTRKQKEANEHYLPLFELQRKQYDAEMVRIETEYAAQVDRIGRQRAAETRAEEQAYESLRSKTERRIDAELAAVEEAYSEKMAAAASARDEAWAKMAARWMEATGKVAQVFATLRSEGDELFPPWDRVRLADRVPAGVRCGEFQVDLADAARRLARRPAPRPTGRPRGPGPGVSPLPRPLFGPAPRPRRRPQPPPFRRSRP